LGTAPIGGLFSEVDEDVALATIDAAWNGGIRFFDTAPLYGHGLAEERLGKALAGRPRDEYIVATKVGRVLKPGDDPGTIFHGIPPLRPVFDFSADGALRSLEDSLKRMGLDRVDILHVHDPDEHEHEALSGAFPALRRLRDEGVIGAVGAGMNQSAMLSRFVEQADVDCVLEAGRWSLLDRTAEADLLPAAAGRQVAVIAGGVFNSGLLADPKPGAPFDYAPAPQTLVDQALRLRTVCERHGLPLRAAALQFPQRHPAIRSVVVGARTPQEIEENIALSTLELPEELWTELG
jgi:D-threo-aldose 1-dehydrogenase